MPAEGHNQTILQKLGWPHWSLLLQYLLALNHVYVVSHKPSSLASNRLNQQWILEASITILRWNRHDAQAKLAKSVKECWIDQRSMGCTWNSPAPPMGNHASGSQMHWQETQGKYETVRSYWEEGSSLSLELLKLLVAMLLLQGKRCLKMEPKTTEKWDMVKKKTFSVALICSWESNHALM